MLEGMQVACCILFKPLVDLACKPAPVLTEAQWSKGVTGDPAFMRLVVGLKLHEEMRSLSQKFDEGQKEFVTDRLDFLWALISDRCVEYMGKRCDEITEKAKELETSHEAHTYIYI